jgi:hypothetical protein
MNCEGRKRESGLFMKKIEEPWGFIYGERERESSVGIVW